MSSDSSIVPRSSRLIDILVRSQNKDGGWAYRSLTASRSLTGSRRSWTEPTVYASLALLAAGEKDAARKGLQWIRGAELPHGGWPPQAGIEESTWVTSLVALLPAEELGPGAHARAIAWLLSTTGQESTTDYRLRQWLLGHHRPADQEFSGWPWVPGAAAWVGPTALAILALAQEARRRPSPEIQMRIDSGRQFLLTRMCSEGGWNHGSSRAAGYESRPYPETTGMALLALRGVVSPKIDRALAAATTFLAGCRSADAFNWLWLGLLAHGRSPEGLCPSIPAVYRTLPETALALLLDAGPEGRKYFMA